MTESIALVTEIVVMMAVETLSLRLGAVLATRIVVVRESAVLVTETMAMTAAETLSRIEAGL